MWRRRSPPCRKCSCATVWVGEIDLMVLVATHDTAALAECREHVRALKGIDDVTTVPVLLAQFDRH